MTTNTKLALDFHDQFQRLVAKINLLEKKTQDYGCGVDLYPAEVHAISAIGNYPKAHISQIARILGVTRGATQQMVGRLQKKELIKKYSDPKDGKKVFLELTRKGQIAFEGHDKYHAELTKYVSKYFKNLEESEISSLMRFFDGIGSFLDDYNN